MSPLPDFDHVRPSTIDEALSLLDDGALPYHGGTELLTVMRLGLLRPHLLVDLKSVAGLDAISRDDGALVIGAGATHRAVATSDLVRADVPLVAEVVRRVGNVRVRAAGTLAGNLCFAEPRSDVTTALVALGASLVLCSPRGERSVAVDDFLLGAYTTDLGPDELLTEVRVPAGSARRSAYRKLQTGERPVVGVAALVGAAPGDGCTVVVGAVGERPVTFRAEAPDAVDPHAAAQSIDVVEDLSGTAEYKRHVTAVTIARALDDLRDPEAT